MNAEHEKLYQIYYTMGSNRTLRKVAELTGVAVSTVERISSKDKWRHRVIDDNARANTDTDIPKDEQTLISLIQTNSLSKLYLAIERLEPKTIKDAKTLLEIFQLVSGRPTAIHSTAESQGVNLASLTPEQQAELGELAALALWGDNPTA